MWGEWGYWVINETQKKEEEEEGNIMHEVGHGGAWGINMTTYITHNPWFEN